MVMPNIFATQPTGNVAASLLDTNFTFLESQGVQGLTTTGSANSYIATPADAWVTGYSSYVGRALTVVPNFGSTGAATINVSGLGVASIYKNVGGVNTALASGDLASAIPAILICDGTNFLLVNPTSSAAFTAGTQNTINPIATSQSHVTAHGLSRKPDIVITWLECLTNSNGYTAGQRYYINGTVQATASGAVGVTADATNVTLSTDTVLPSVEALAGGGTVTITAANWKIVAQPLLVNGITF